MAIQQAIDIDSGLERLGYSSFRPGQREAIDTLLAKGRLLLVAPTGGGKSLAYQLPAALLQGTTLVISPLISLMHDQVSALEGRGIAATFLAATLPPDELRARMRRIAEGAYQLVYLAPERLAFPGFREIVRGLSVPLVAVDEAHCISQWGHDFRPDYLQIHELLAELSSAGVLACTATATPVVRDEILSRLGLPDDTPQLIHGFARPNLRLHVAETSGRQGREAHVDALLREALGAPGAARGVAIVYCPTRASTEREAERLGSCGWRAAPYHAGLDREDRRRAHDAFMAGDLDVVAATVAFGMGIDRPDVRAVVHLAPPGSIEEYYQEVGRAGRDGAPAWGLMLTSPGDMPQRRRLIESTEGITPEIVEHKWNLFLELMRWAEGGSCRHDAILRYFGDEAETLAGCGHCDACVALSGEEGQDPEAVTLLVRKALSGVARVHRRFGLGVAVKLLRGQDDPRLARSGLSQLKTFGVLKEHDDDWLTKLLRRCVTAGWVDFTPGDRPMLVLTPAGRLVMQGERPARLVLPPRRIGGSSLPASPRRPTHQPDAEETLDDDAQALFESLRKFRLEQARAAGVPPYVVASDRTLRAMAVARPRGMPELLAVHGIGPAKAEQYGAGFLAIVARALDPSTPGPGV